MTLAIAVWTSSIQYLEDIRMESERVSMGIDCGSSSSLSIVGVVSVDGTGWPVMLTVDRVFSSVLQTI